MQGSAIARFLSAALLLALAGASAAQTPPPPGAPKEAVLGYWAEVMKAATARVEVLDAKGAPIRQTYGIVLGAPPTLVVRLTALADAARIEATFAGGQKVAGAHVVSIDPANDLAVLETQGNLPRPPEADEKNTWRFVEKLYVIPGPGMDPAWPMETASSIITLGKFQFVPVTGDHAAGLPAMYPSGWWTGLLGRIEDETGVFNYITPKETVLPVLFGKPARRPISEAAAAAKNFLDATTAHGLLARAILKAHEDPAGAAPFFDLAQKRDPKMAEVPFYRGKVLFKEEKLAEAETAFRQAIVLNPEWEEAYQMAGGAANQQGAYDKALEIYAEGLKNRPNSTKIRIHKWGALYNLGRYPEAVATLEEALQIEPNNELALYNLGATYARTQRRPDAETIHEKLRTLGSNYAPQLRKLIDES